jgi:signal transduction histidine kinase/PAS domain-containing protein
MLPSIPRPTFRVDETRARAGGNMSMKRETRLSVPEATDDTPGDRWIAWKDRLASLRAQAVLLIHSAEVGLRRATDRKRLLQVRTQLSRLDVALVRRLAAASWSSVSRWFLAHTFIPAWVPQWWARLPFAYAVAALSQVIAVVATIVLASRFPTLAFAGAPSLLAVLLVALGWGAAPGLVASAVGALLLDFIAVPRLPSAVSHRADVVNALVMVLIGVSITLAASQTEHARRHAEDLAIETERARRDAEALRTRLDAIIDAMADGVAVYDNGGHVLRMNRAGRELLGRDDASGSTSSVLSMDANDDGMRLQDLRDDGGRPFTRDRWPLFRILLGEVLTGTKAVDVLRCSNDGRELLLNLSGAPIREAAGRILGAVIIARDVTERRQLERRTHDSLDALLAMAETLVLAPSQDGSAQEAFSDDQTDTLSSASGVAQRLAALTRNVLGCQRVGIVSIEPDTEILRPLAVAGLSSEQEHQWWAEQPLGARLSESRDRTLVARLRAGKTALVNRDGSAHQAAPNPEGVGTILVAPLRLGQTLVGLLTLDYGSGTHLHTRDERALAEAVARLTTLVIERERLLLDRAEARARELALQVASQRMNEFLGIASHELKTPLTVIKASVQIMGRHFTPQPESSQPDSSVSLRDDVDHLIQMAPAVLERVERQTGRLNRLVDDLLDVSRIQAGKLEMRPVACHLAAVVADCVEEQRQAAPSRRIDLDLPAGDGIVAQADPERVSQVVTNYLTNALKYSKKERPVAVRLQLEASMARLSVCDEGPGLPAEEQERIWERFYRAPDVQVEHGSGVGLGLGLHISKTIVERHGGQVGVESILGQGSTFWFTLPLVATHE